MNVQYPPKALTMILLFVGIIGLWITQNAMWAFAIVFAPIYQAFIDWKEYIETRPLDLLKSQHEEIIKLRADIVELQTAKVELHKISEAILEVHKLRNRLDSLDAADRFQNPA